MRIRVQELQGAAAEAMLINLRDGDGGALAQMVELKISFILQVGSSLVSILFLLFFPGSKQGVPLLPHATAMNQVLPCVLSCCWTWTLM